MVANSQASSVKVGEPPKLLEGIAKPSWYRLLRRGWWAWNDISPIDTEALLACIAISDKPRTSERLDTVANYQPGNWNYEWSKRAVTLQNQAKKICDTGRKDLAQQTYINASFCASIAAYPYIRGDDLSASAQTLVHQNYRAAGELNTYRLREIQVPFQNKTINCYLHLPHEDGPCPVVMVSGGVDSLQTEFWQVFHKYLAPLGMAMLTVDLPGVGTNSAWRLGQDTSVLHQQVLHYLAEVPWIDHHRIGILGTRFGGNIAARLAFLEPQRLKAAVCIGAGANLIFTDHQRFNQLPQMTKDCLANRIGVDAANVESLYYRCHSFSLKSQGLLGATRTLVPLLSMGHKDDHICPGPDIELIANSSRNGESHISNGKHIFDLQHRFVEQAANWLADKL